jgi:ATP-binding cassette, subfamily B (MDR/TAP), member 1
MFIIFGRLVNNFTDYLGSGSIISQQEFQHAVNRNSLYLVYIFIGKFVLGYIGMLCIRISSIRISSALRLAYLRALFAQPIASIDKVSPGKVSTRITTSANTIQYGISQQFSLFIQAISCTIGVYIIAFVKSALLTLVASASLPFVLISHSIAITFCMKIHNRTGSMLDEASSLASEVFSSIRIVVAFGAEDRLHRRYKNILQDAARNEKKAAPYMGMMMWPMFFALYATFGLTFWFGIHQFVRGHVDSVGSITV